MRVYVHLDAVLPCTEQRRLLPAVAHIGAKLRLQVLDARREPDDEIALARRGVGGELHCARLNTRLKLIDCEL